MNSAIAQFLRYLVSERNASELTIKSYREDLFSFVDWIQVSRGFLPEPEQLGPQDLRPFQAALQEAGYARSSIARKLAALRSFFKFAMREGLAAENPAKPLRNPRRQRKLPNVLSDEEVGRLLLAPPSTRVDGLRDRAILETIYSAGLRVSELVSLSDGDLDRHEQIIRVRGKGKKERLCPLGSFALKAIDDYAAKRTRSHDANKLGRKAPVFVNRFGNRLTTRSIGRMLEKHLAVAGLDRSISPHTLRHSFAT
ncbi:MAG: tyrosine-type recombinase/integrase, partial [Planctomycetota bacterium]